MCFTFAINISLIVSSKIAKTSEWLKSTLETFPVEAFVAGSSLGVLGRGVALTQDPQGLAPLARMVRGKEGSAAQMAVLYRSVPFWGLRMGIYSHSASHYGEGSANKSAVTMLPYWFLTGCWTEVWTRTITNPFNKVRYHRDLMIEQKAENASILGAVRKLTTERGPAGIFQDTAKYRVEVPRMGILFGVWHTLRNTVLSQVDADIGQVNVGVRAVVDGAAGAAAAAASIYATHPLREATYDSASVFAQRPLQLALRTEVPATAIVMAGFGLAMAAFKGAEHDANLSGWADVVEERSEYGGRKERSLGCLSVLDD